MPKYAKYSGQLVPLGFTFPQSDKPDELFGGIFVDNALA